MDALTDRVPDTERGLQTSLHHIYLPKLDATGIIADDRNANVVRTGPRLDAANYLLTGVE